MGEDNYDLGPWSLEDLFAGFDAPEMDAALTAVEEMVQKLEGKKDSLAHDINGDDFQLIVAVYEALHRQLGKIGAFASLRFSGDTQDQQAQSFMSRARQLAAEVSNRLLFFELWWKNLSEETVERLMNAAPGDRYYFEALRLERPYTLSEAEEKVINLKNVNGPNALVSLYTTITSRYSYRMLVDGEEKELTGEEVRSYLRDPNSEVRERAYKALLEKAEGEAPILGQIYQYVARDWHSEKLKIRGYASPIAVRNLANDIPDPVIDALLEVCRDNKGIFQRFFALKATLLGVDKLRRYDLYAPISELEQSFTLSQASSLVLDSFRDFDSGMAGLAERVFGENHYDSEVRKGKRGGAFCYTAAPDLTPWILQSFNGKASDVSTMAHELGHAVHSMLAEHHSSLTQHAALPLAETASTFGELLLLDRLLEDGVDPELERYLLFSQMDDNYSTVMRQAYFAMFEESAHEMIQNGASVDEVSERYLENLRDQFGDSLEISDDFKYEWVGVPHFYFAPFYVYAYTFGQLLVLSLYGQYKEQGNSFKPRYLQILAAGGSNSITRTLEDAGIDIADPSFWQSGFDILESSLARLEKLVKE